ncbi:unnamed protein product, partial [Rotaria sp. Silwood1]
IINFIEHDGSQKHKITVIENIFTYAPIRQQFIMVGDSGELDPEIYGNIARKYPNRIKMIFIRIVQGGKNNNNRFEIAFKDISQDKWKLFFNATELPEKLYDDENSINENDDINFIQSNNANILSISLFYIIILILLILVFIIEYV